MILDSFQVLSLKDFIYQHADPDKPGVQYSGWCRIEKGPVCYVEDWNRLLTIMYDGKVICDLDSKMAEDYFEIVNEIWDSKLIGVRMIKEEFV
jgi:hypothetical protein